MKLKKALFILGLIVPLMAGCGGDNSSEPSSSEPSSSEPSSSSSSSSSESAPAVVEEKKETLLTNMQGLKNYRLKQEEVSVMEMEHAGMKTNSGQIATTIYDTTENGFKTLETQTMYEEFKLSDYAESYGITVDQVIVMLNEMGGYTIDKGNDFARYEDVDDGAHNTTYDIYRYDSSAKQYIDYQINKSDNTMKKICYSLDMIKVDLVKELFFKVVNDGTYNGETKTYSYSFTEAEQKGRSLSLMGDGRGDLYTSISLTVENNLPKEAKINFDLEVVNELLGDYGYGEIKDSYSKYSFYDFNNVELTVPTDPVVCACHEPEYHDDNGYAHMYRCRHCNKLLGDGIEAHDFDSTHGICKECGRVDGLNRGSNHEIKDNDKIIYQDENVTMWYVVYLDSKKGEHYSGGYFSSVSKTPFEYNSKDYDQPGYQLSYYSELGIALKMTTTHDYLAAGSCVELYTTTYAAYKDLTITFSSEIPMVGSQTLAEYVESHDPFSSFTAYSQVEISHDHGLSERQYHVIDSCSKIGYYVCNRCGMEYDFNTEYDHDEFTYTLIDKATARGLISETEEFDRVFEGNTDDNSKFIKKECKDCGQVYVLAITNSQIEGVSNHTTEPLDYQYFTEHDGDLEVSNGHDVFPCIYDSNNHCIFHHSA